MNKIYYFLFLSLLLGACTKEDALEPTGANDDYFTVPATATDPESVMRREFYEETGVHLLFNDTLRHEQRGTFEDGNPRWYTETVDLGYSMTSFDDAPALTYLQTKQEKEKAVEFVSKYILPHLGQAVRPYSFLMVNTIYRRDPDTYRKGILKYYIGMRTMALSMEPILKLETEEDYATHCIAIFQSYVKSKLSTLNDEATEPFELISDKWYYKVYADFDADFWDKYNALEAEGDEDGINAYCEDIANQCGFIRFDNYFCDFPWSASYDLEDFVKAVLGTPEEKFMEMYEDYPLVREKYTIMQKIIADMGFIF